MAIEFKGFRVGPAAASPSPWGAHQVQAWAARSFGTNADISAAIGTQEIAGIRIDQHGLGFTGYAAVPPQPTDTLKVRIDGGAEIDTGLVAEAGSVLAAPTVRTRRNVYALGTTDWPDTLLWYARAVKAMKARALADRTSWRFMAAIHGINRARWDLYAITQPLPADPEPPAADVTAFFNQCQHQSWYFLPWHRGYLQAIEDLLRAAIKDLGGPHDTWALPYWNYMNSGENVLPPAFRSPDWPDGTGDNPLFVTQRWGELSGATPYDFKDIDGRKQLLDALAERQFTGPGGGGSAGFGGVETGFSWSNSTNGLLENFPHNDVHVLIGGRSGTNRGLMTSPITAALDPIFWLHHCNIDRLWEAWNRTTPPASPPAGPTDWKNPTDADWLEGPPRIGERAFAMPRPDATQWTYTPADVVDITAMGFAYDTLDAASGPESLGGTADRRARLKLAPIGPEGGATMARQDKVELLGASGTGLRLSADSPVRATVGLDSQTRKSVSASLAGAESLGQPDRVFLNLENIVGDNDALRLGVYVGPADPAAAAASPAQLVGTVSLFGVENASRSDAAHGGNGISAVLEISHIIDSLHLADNFSADELAVEVVPFGDVPEGAEVTIGRISLYRQF
jgi:Common central domain of tyrosinase